MPSNFKNLVHARMAKTGETWQTAARAVRDRAQTPAASQESVDEAGNTSVYGRCFGEDRCPLAGWDGKGQRPECRCLGVDTSEPLLDGDDY
jgi:hypothetical protein